MELLKLPVMEITPTLQGEGFWSGTPAIFIRLAGCDVRCHWCDIKSSWETKGFPLMSAEEILEKIQNYPIRRMVITGGEPSIYDLRPWISLFQQKGYKCHVETAGNHPLLEDWDWVCLSPKKFVPALEENYKKANELKVIIYHPHDLQWALQQAKHCRKTTHLFVQPEWSKKEKVLPAILDFLKKHPQWRLSLQTHKYIGIP